MYLLAFFLEMQRRLEQTKQYYRLCYFVWKETSHKPIKVATAKMSFPSEYIIDTTYFNECFLFHLITGRHYFLHKFIVTHRFGETAMLLCSFSVCDCSTFSFINAIFKTQKLSRGMFLIKRYTQVFMTRMYFNKLFQISENKNTEHLTPTTL